MNTNGSVLKAKTRMCNNLSKGQCPYGKKCHFAHDVNELQVQICGFGDKCVFVRNENGIVINSPNACKVCRFMHPTETEAGYAKRIYISIQHTTPAPVVATTRQTNISPLKLDLSANKPIFGWTAIVQSRKTNVVPSQAQSTKTINSFSAIDNRSEHIVAKVKAENLLDHVDEWVDDDVKDVKLTVDYPIDYYPGAKVFVPNPGSYQNVKVKNF